MNAAQEFVTAWALAAREFGTVWGPAVLISLGAMAAARVVRSPSPALPPPAPAPRSSLARGRGKYRARG